MKVETIRDDCFLIYINNCYFTFLNWEDKDEIEKNVKKLILKLNRIYHLSLLGFYKMDIYINKKIGMVIELTKMDDFGFEIDTIDLRVSLFLNSPFLLEVNDIDLLKGHNYIYINHNKYYIDIKDISNQQVTLLSEWATLIYGKTADRIKKESQILKLSF